MPHPYGKEKLKSSGGSTVVEQLHKDLLFAHQEQSQVAHLIHKHTVDYRWQSRELQLKKHEENDEANCI